MPLLAWGMGHLRPLPAWPATPGPNPPLPGLPAGLDREPELLQHLFACLSLICKHLVKALASEEQLLRVLRVTQRLRHHRAEHVRALAAEALGYLLRQAWHAGLACAGLARLATLFSL